MLPSIYCISGTSRPFSGESLSCPYCDPTTFKYEWVDKKDSRVSEPRILIERESFGDKHAENMLIKGDNLLALKAVLQDFRNKIKLIYIDPPFNTGAAFEYYEDGLEQSIWLTMMRDRLVLLQKLLRPNGAIFVEIDDSEYGYLRVLLDEVFERKNYITTISIRRSAATGHKAINPAPVNVTEYILVYAKDKDKWVYKPRYVLREQYDKQYRYFIKNVNEPFEKWEFISLNQRVVEELGYQNVTHVKRELGTETFNKEVVKFAFAHPNEVIRFALPDYQGVSQAARDLIDKSKTEQGRVFLLTRQEHSDMYFYRGSRRCHPDFCVPVRG
jgi:adenine-specific DNA-methyltransferase